MYSARKISEFCKRVLQNYAVNRRDMPWRDAMPDGSFDPYRVMVSEIMLQQTQVQRVVLKYHEFLNKFPDVSALARTELGPVLRVWQGLGYNRRAKYLWCAAEIVTRKYAGQMPTDQKELMSLPGIGVNTAAAICAYAYNTPVVFVETNIRTVVIHEFFSGVDDVPDAQILAVIEEALAHGKHRAGSVREWYWALMDYGAYIKATKGNLSRRARSYVTQPPLAGSRRQIRGYVLRLLADREMSLPEIAQHISDPRLEGVIEDLIQEGMVRRSGLRVRL